MTEATYPVCALTAHINRTLQTPLSTLGLTVFERGWLSSNNILAIGQSQTSVVDTGYVTHAPQTVQLLGLSLGDRALDQIVNTHLHSDHCGGNAALQEVYPRAITLIPPGQAGDVRDWNVERLTFAPTGQSCARFGFTGTLHSGGHICLGDVEWEVHSAAGHDPHSLIFFEPTHKVLISADALWENGFGVVFPELDDDGGFDEVADTLSMIERLDPAWVIPGHGRVFSNVSSALSKARSRLQQFRVQPHKHRRHALKVLIVFKLLEWRQTSWEQLLRWFNSSDYFLRIARKDSTVAIAEILENLLSELEKSNAIRREGSLIDVA